MAIGHPEESEDLKLSGMKGNIAETIKAQCRCPVKIGVSQSAGLAWVSAEGRSHCSIMTLWDELSSMSFIHRPQALDLTFKRCQVGDGPVKRLFSAFSGNVSTYKAARV